MYLYRKGGNTRTCVSADDKLIALGVLETAEMSEAKCKLCQMEQGLEKWCK